MTRHSGILDTIEMPREVKQYDEGWGRMMVDIWKKRLDMYKAVDTGNLKNSVMGGLESIGGLQASFRFHFVNYGIHVENGVGNGYRHDNGGDLGWTPTRVERPWFSPSWWYSRKVIAEKMVEIIGDTYFGMFSNIDNNKT